MVFVLVLDERHSSTSTISWSTSTKGEERRQHSGAFARDRILPRSRCRLRLKLVACHTINEF